MVLHFLGDVLLALNVAVTNPRAEMSPAVQKLEGACGALWNSRAGFWWLFWDGGLSGTQLGHGVAAGIVGLAAFVVGALLLRHVVCVGLFNKISLCKLKKRNSTRHQDTLL